MTLGQWLVGIKAKIEALASREYIVEQGTSGDWIYRKWNSGFVELWHGYVNVPISAGSTTSSNVVVNFPFAVTDPVISFGLWQNTTAAQNVGIIDIASISTTQLVLRSHRSDIYNTSYGVTPSTFITVVGRWK